MQKIDFPLIHLFVFPQAAVYNSGSACAAFLANIDTTSDITVNFNGNSYLLPAWSVSILPDCKNVVLNTAKVCSFLACAHGFVSLSLSLHNFPFGGETTDKFCDSGSKLHASISESFVRVELYK